MPVSSAIKAVTFDVGGTLLTAAPSVGDIYSRIAALNGGPRIPAKILEERFRQVWGRVRPFQHHRDDWERLVDEVFAGLLPKPASQTLFDTLFSEFSRASAWRIYDDVIPTLECLAGQGLDLAIVSNWDDRLRPLLEDLRLDRYFNCIVISCEVGFVKPSAVIFEEALRRLGCPASAALHVGDALREDFSGATAAGLQALHLRRDTPSHDLQIQSLTEIPRWIASVGRPGSDREVEVGSRCPSDL